MRGFYRLKAELFMRAVIPVSNLVFGVSRTDLVGMGGPLPRVVGAQWARWCRRSGYVETGFGREVRTHGYDILDIPSLWLNADDDDIAVIDNVDDMTRVFAKMAQHAEKRTLHPAAYGLKAIGHMGYFHRSAQGIWPSMVDWLEQHCNCS